MFLMQVYNFVQLKLELHDFKAINCFSLNNLAHVKNRVSCSQLCTIIQTIHVIIISSKTDIRIRVPVRQLYIQTTMYDNSTIIGTSMAFNT